MVLLGIPLFGNPPYGPYVFGKASLAANRWRTRLNPTCGMVRAKQQGIMVKRQLGKGAPIDSNSTCHWHVPQSGLLHGSVDLPAIPTGDVNEALGRIVAA